MEVSQLILMARAHHDQSPDDPLKAGDATTGERMLPAVTVRLLGLPGLLPAPPCCLLQKPSLCCPSLPLLPKSLWFRHPACCTLQLSPEHQPGCPSTAGLHS